MANIGVVNCNMVLNKVVHFVCVHVGEYVCVCVCVRAHVHILCKLISN